MSDQQSINVGIALLRSDGEILLPGVGEVRLPLEELAYEKGMFDVAPHRLQVRPDSDTPTTFEYRSLPSGLSWAYLG